MLGVISNPFSRTNARRRLHDRLLPRFLPDPKLAIHTRTLADVDQALRTMLFERGVNVLGLNGGDGTLHLGVNRLLALAREVEDATGEVMPLPPLLFLNGGTLNIVSRATGTKGNPDTSVRRFVRHWVGKPLGSVPSVELAVLQVDSGEDRRYGFVFGTEIVANALEMYGMFGEGYTGLARFMAELTLGYTLHTRMWQEHGWKLDAPTTPLTVDGVTYPRYMAAVAATIDLAIMKGALTAFRVPENGAGFFTKLMLESDPKKVILSIPGLMVDRPPDSVRDVPEADRLNAIGGYTLDGEIFLDRTPAGCRRPVTVRRAPFPIRAIAPPL